MTQLAWNLSHTSPRQQREKKTERTKLLVIRDQYIETIHTAIKRNNSQHTRHMFESSVILITLLQSFPDATVRFMFHMISACYYVFLQELWRTY